jgi:hypothetical protein
MLFWVLFLVFFSKQGIANGPTCDFLAAKCHYWNDEKHCAQFDASCAHEKYPDLVFNNFIQQKKAEHEGAPPCQHDFGESQLSVVVPIKGDMGNEMLPIFLPYMENFLRIYYCGKFQIIIVRQIDALPFNKGILFNIGTFYVPGTAGCYLFQDVDLLPYISMKIQCTENSAHMMAATLCHYYSWFKCEQTTGLTFGGAVSMSAETFVRIGGFSTRFWGWGGEDDNLLSRARSRGIQILRNNSQSIMFHIAGISAIDKSKHGDYARNIANIEKSHENGLRETREYAKLAFIDCSPVTRLSDYSLLVNVHLSDALYKIHLE